jgi:hypothetical protein
VNSKSARSVGVEAGDPDVAWAMSYVDEMVRELNSSEISTLAFQ